jgi:hypothetical protein
MKKALKKIIFKNWTISLSVLFVLFLLLLSPPAVKAASTEKVDPQIIEKTIDGMETLNDLQKEYYKSALKNILTLDDLNLIIQRDKDYENAQGLKNAERGVDKSREIADEVGKEGAKMITIVSDAQAWLEAAKAYNDDPTNAKKDQVYSEKAFRFYNNLLPFGGIVFSMMADSLEDARDRAEFEANQRKIMDKIISDYEIRAEIEMKKLMAAMDRIVTESVAVKLIFGEDFSEEPRWHTLRFFSDGKIEKIARYMQEHPDSRYNAYNAGIFLRMMKNGGPVKEAFLKNMKGGGPAGFAKHSPVYMTITDPFGHKYGVEPDTKRLLCDDAAICSPLQKAGDAQYIVIPSIYNGVYQIQLVGYADGDYSFLFHGFNHNSELQGKIKQKGYIRKGEVLAANLTITLQDNGYKISEPNFVKIADAFPIPADPETLLPAIDRDPLEVYFEGEPCLSSYSYVTSQSDVVMTKMFEGVKQDYFICLKKEPRPTYTFFTNKLLGPQAINEQNLQFIDGENNSIKGLYEVKDFTFSFTPNVPLRGEVSVILKGGKEGICGKTKICLKKDLDFTVNGLEPSPESENDVPFEFIGTNPVLIKKSLQIINAAQVTKKDVALTTLSFKSFPPNTFFFVYNISSPVPYEIIKGENDLIKFKISELKPQETLNIELTYAAMLWGADYFSSLDVNKINTDYDPAVLEKFTRTEAGIEVEDPKIKELAQKIVGEEKNPFWKAYKIYNWITNTITYDYQKEEAINKGELVETGALLTLQRRKGVCQDYTDLFLALARASGIPSRYVTLYVYKENKAQGHAFPEIYLPPYGWIPLDPTWGTNFDVFARAEPGLMIIAKGDGLTKNHLLDYQLEGADTQGVKVLSSVGIFNVALEEEKNWVSFYGSSPFFVDMYELLSLSLINGQLFTLEAYNKEIGKPVFALAEKPKTSAVVTAQQALEAYLNGNYPQVRSEVQEVIGEQLKAASTSFSLLAQKLQEHMESPYSKDSLILYKIRFQEGGGNPTETEILQQINQTKKDMGVVAEQIKAGNNYAAVNNLISSYFSTSEMYSRIISDMVSSKIKTSVYSPGNIFRFNWGSVVFFGVILIFMVLMPILWFWMWINCLIKKEFRHLNKIIWFLIIFFTYIFIPFGAIIYLFVEFRKGKVTKKKGKN